MLTRKPEHLKTFDYQGIYRYSLTFCTHQRRELFTMKPLVDLVLEQIVRAAGEEAFAITAYCFMPDHVHLLVEGQTDASNCKRFIARAKQGAGYYFKQRFGAGLWQRYGFERALRDSEATLVVARYILANPLRAHLVERIEDYPYVGSFTYSLSELMESISSPAKAGHYG